MLVAVTFCNQHSTPRLATCAVDLASGARAWLPVPDSFETGAAGLAEIDGDLLVACQRGGVVRYNAALEVVAFIPTPDARNLHSILHRPEERALYVTSAHNDTLFRYQLNDKGTDVVGHEVVFCGDPQRRGQDRYHLNSVADWQGDLYVTMFGAADGPTHKHRRNGRVVRVGDGSTLVDGLYHPHSLLARGDDLFVVESQGHAVRRIAGGPPASWIIPGGYPRGIVATDDGNIWVGISGLRKKSSSLGTPNVIDSTSPLDFHTRVVELDTGTGAIGRTIDLTHLAAEVFDIRALPAGVRFTPDPDAGLAQRVDALEETFRDQDSSRRALERELDRTPRRRLEHFVARVRRRIDAARNRGAH